MGPAAERRGRRRPGWVVAALVLVVVASGIALGPRPVFEGRWVEPELPPDDLDAYLVAEEEGVPDLRPGDSRAIVWAAPDAPDRTPTSLVYLHGFSADRHELEPVVTEIGRELGANVYFARLTGHGRDEAAMAEATAADWLDDTVEALAIGEAIGERVVLVGTSTGGTLATWAATRPEAAGRIEAIVLVSPNYQPKDASSRVLLYPWGGLLARMVVGPERCFQAENQEQDRHWTTCYPTAALLPMMALVEHVRTTSVEGWRVPVLLVYSPEDLVVDATETERVLASIPGDLLRVHVIDETGDPARHVLAGDILSPGTNGELRTVVTSFVRDALGSPR
ncbi:MAG: alpha/beta fold hydrolase [Gemmatimonadetes bacterium]|nr:alpha/beta fold hydrolase [Gemmatimonadota bacterium]